MKLPGSALPLLACIVVLAVPCRVARVAAEEPDAAMRQQVAGLIRDLDSEYFNVRERAAAEFQRLMAKPALRQFLAGEIQHSLLQPDLSFEARTRLTRWVPQLPAVKAPPAGEPAPEELDRLVLQLDDDAYGLRLSALKRLCWFLGNSRAADPVLSRIKARLADPALDPMASQRLESIWQVARGAWLCNPVAEADLPPVSDQQIERWLSDLARAVGDDKAARHACRIAEMEMLDLMARDAEVPRLLKAIEEKLATAIDPDANKRLEKLRDLGKPAMVAEYWTGRQHLSEQHLIVGVPSQAAGASRPSHFDRIDDQTAHCVSGQTLQPRDYSANVAIPHPLAENAFFRLVNLPTPRRRMAYTYQVKIDLRIRLAQISRQTLDRLLAEQRLLSKQEVVMLAQLDPDEVSHFASRYLPTIDDEPYDGPFDVRSGERPSRHGMVCVCLATDGTKAAAPGLVEAIDKNRFLPPTSASPYRVHWLAAFSIAQRDPWHDVDAWLAAQIGKTEPLAENQRADGATAGATAAALLLKRFQQPPAPMGLQASPDPALNQFGIDGYRFATPDAQEKVGRWWQGEQDKKKRP